MKILYDNQIFNATINALTENPDYPFTTALIDTRLTKIGRTLDVDDQTFLFSFSAAIDADYFTILNHNFTDSATVKIQANTSDSWGSPALDETLTVEDTIIINFSSTETYQYWRLYVDDPTNTDGYLEFSYCYLGEELVMPGMNRAMIIPYKSNSIATKSQSGQLYGDRRLKYKAAQITFNIVDETERQSIIDFWDTVDVVRPFILLIWEDDLDVEPPIYCALTKELEWNKLDLNGLLWSLVLDFEECF